MGSHDVLQARPAYPLCLTQRASASHPVPVCSSWSSRRTSQCPAGFELCCLRLLRSPLLRGQGHTCAARCVLGLSVPFQAGVVLPLDGIRAKSCQIFFPLKFLSFSLSSRLHRENHQQSHVRLLCCRVWEEHLTFQA